MSSQNEQNDRQEEKKNVRNSRLLQKDSKKVFFTRIKRESEEKVKESAAAGIGNTVPQNDGKAEAAKTKGLSN